MVQSFVYFAIPHRVYLFYCSIGRWLGQSSDCFAVRSFYLLSVLSVIRWCVTTVIRFLGGWFICPFVGCVLLHLQSSYLKTNYCPAISTVNYPVASPNGYPFLRTANCPVFRMMNCPFFCPVIQSIQRQNNAFFLR